MVFDVSTLVPKAQGGVSLALKVAGYSLLAFLILGLIGTIVAIIYVKKKWNLSVEFKLTRSDGRITNSEWGKGFYNSKRGVVMVKRPKGRAVPIPIFDIRRYIQGSRIITVVQVGPEDFRPVLNDSWTEHVQTYKNDETGEIKEVKESILNIKVDSGLNKAWKSSWEGAAKNAYSIRSFFSQFQTPIAIGIVILCCFVGFAILWTKVS